MKTSGDIDETFHALLSIDFSPPNFKKDLGKRGIVVFSGVCSMYYEVRNAPNSVSSKTRFRELFLVITRVLVHFVCLGIRNAPDPG